MCFLSERKTTKLCVGQAHKTFRLFRHTESTLPIQTNTINIPNNPSEKKKPASAILKTFCALPFLLNVSKMKTSASSENKLNGVKKDLLSLALFPFITMLVSPTKGCC